MLRGDLSNDIPRRVLVTIDPIVIRTTTTYIKYKFIKKTSERVSYDPILLNKLFLYATRNDVNLELVSFDHDQDTLDLIVNHIDNAGLNPFRYATAYKSPKKLADALPYRPEVIGVIDIPERRLMYGHWALDF